ncbi:Nicotinate phosphoribosyltransferase pncB2 [Legionella massiliensis]|uniref:Nicotinate phosphoribosyltransferase n=1 Tax=Legionella massiliensis TaxID=1034943 RepID=A0A078KX81_9GAMM|nr:nicotinate phosphoribosyltransferase [Legionella massiliensis]CDZ77586.1 Nicotinate phosphoribosyltransferase pncB2 [Legionella massiliensis]CEE13324.1 Nicotinate phosphoribosyltransferase pncB2 [Legionella massiliensis]
MINFTGTYTDKYQITMAQAYFLRGHQNQLANFDYFFRRLPFDGGYAIFAGLDDLLRVLQDFHFDKADIEFLASQGFHPDFLNYLKTFRFQGTIYSSLEGDLIFPVSPVLTVEANIIEAQLIETILLNILNFQTLIATKANRIYQVAAGRKLIDFGLRRSQGPAGYYASRAAIVGGFDSTSNVRAGRDYGIAIAGTMAHSFVQSYDDELSAFREFAESWPDHCVLLVDTYNTLESGIPNAIKVAKELEAKGKRLHGIRLDSGDLAYLTKRARQMLDQAGLNYVQIAVSNQLDEYVIKSLVEQESPIDIFGVGTNLVIGAPDAALDGVYKLAFADNKPRIKLSETLKKISLPYKKQVYRILERDGSYLGADVIALYSETKVERMFHPFETSKFLAINDYQQEPLLHKVMENGQALSPVKTLSEIAQYSQQRLSHLPVEYKRITNPHIYKIGLSEELNLRRAQLIAEFKV